VPRSSRHSSTRTRFSVTDRTEAELDVQAVLKEYLRLEREIVDKAKDLLQKRNLPYEQFGKVKRSLANEKNFGLGDEGLEWMTTQIIGRSCSPCMWKRSSPTTPPCESVWSTS